MAPFSSLTEILLEGIHPSNRDILQNDILYAKKAIDNGVVEKYWNQWEKYARAFHMDSFLHKHPEDH